MTERQGIASDEHLRSPTGLLQDYSNQLVGYMIYNNNNISEDPIKIAHR